MVSPNTGNKPSSAFSLFCIIAMVKIRFCDRVLIKFITYADSGVLFSISFKYIAKAEIKKEDANIKEKDIVIIGIKNKLEELTFSFFIEFIFFSPLINMIDSIIKDINEIIVSIKSNLFFKIKNR